MAIKNKIAEKKQTYNKGKKRESYFNYIAVLSVVVSAILGILFCMAKIDENRGNYSSEPSSNIYSKLVLALVTTNEVNITSEEINGALISAVNENKKNTYHNIAINGIYVDIIKETSLVKFYIPITYMNIRFGISGNMGIDLNSDVSKVDIRICDTKIGKLSIPPRIVASMIANRFPDNITCNNSTISFDSKIKFNFAGKTINLELKECEIKNGNLVVKTKGAAGILDDFIKDKLSSLM